MQIWQKIKKFTLPSRKCIKSVECIDVAEQALCAFSSFAEKWHLNTEALPWEMGVQVVQAQPHILQVLRKILQVCEESCKCW